MSANDSNLTLPWNPKHPKPPERLPADQVQLGILLVLFLIGAPINLVSLTKLRSRHSLARTGRLAMLRLHLNISDLMVLFIFVTSTACWKLTYQWRGGDLLCKLVKFLNSTAFQLSSNIMVCVALDRVFTVICGTVFYKRYVNRHPARYVRICVIMSWITAIGVNLSQFFVWVVVAPFPHADPEWKQCVTVWAAAAHFNRLSIRDPANRNFYASAINPPFIMNQYSYNIFHIVAVFWIPAAVIMVCYTIVVFHMFNLSAKRQTSARKKAKAGFIGEDGITQVSNLAMFDVEMTAIGRKKEENHFSNGQSKPSTDHPEEPAPKSPREEPPSSRISSKAYLLPVAIHRMRNKTFRMSLLLVLAYLTCWTPYNTLALGQFFNAEWYKRWSGGVRFLSVLIVFNSVVNPFLYGTLKFSLPWRLNRNPDPD